MRQLPFQYAFRNLGRSKARLAASLIGSSLVVLLILAAGGFIQGMQRTLTQHNTLHQKIIILGTGSEESIERSQIDAATQGIVAASIPTLKTLGDVILASPEIHAALPVRTTPDTDTTHSAVMRGIRPVAFLVHPEVELIEGRQPRPGHDELILGSLAPTRLGLPHDRLAIGQTLHFDDRPWTIVGHFTAPNTVMDAEIWLPLIDLQIATSREATLSCVIVALGNATFADIDIFAKSRLDLDITAIREQDYYASIADFYRPIRAMIIATALLIASGGLLGGLNTMYAAFAARVREVGMLQSLGYTKQAIVLTLTEESLFAAMCGTLIGTTIGLITLDGVAVRFSMGAFALILDPPVLLAGVAGGLLVGIIGAIPPAIRCLRLPITQALKAA